MKRDVQRRGGINQAQQQVTDGQSANEDTVASAAQLPTEYNCRDDAEVRNCPQSDDYQLGDLQ